ncbi:MAG: hypothetical protein HY558_06505 [Euryarchaeota archaeon]|nr:hypothetical protein [Euryarchaeota archaeon]
MMKLAPLLLLSLLLASGARGAVPLLNHTWDHMPLTVSYDLSNPSVRLYRQAIEGVLDRWSRAGGGRVSFEPVLLREAPADILIRFVSSTPGGHRGFLVAGMAYSPQRPGDPCIIEIVAPAGYNAGLVEYTLQHEVGHCLGLDHPPEGSLSVMDPTDSGGAIIAPTREDIAALQAKYKPASPSPSPSPTPRATLEARVTTPESTPAPFVEVPPSPTPPPAIAKETPGLEAALAIGAMLAALLWRRCG